MFAEFMQNLQKKKDMYAI